MAKVYANLIVKGIKTIEQIPEKIRDEVIDVLVSCGFFVQ